MKIIVEKFEDFIKRINEELSFNALPVEYNKYSFNNGRLIEYKIKHDGKSITIEFENKGNGVYVRNYQINKSWKKKVIENGNKIIAYVTYITKVFIDEYKPHLVAIYHLPDGSTGEANKRAKMNKLYLSNLVKDMEYNYEHYPYHVNQNEEFSFIFNDPALVNKYKNDIPQYLDENYS